MIIVNLDGIEMLGDLLQDLEHQETSGLNTETILVDNNSSDGSVEFVLDKFPGVKFIGLDRNIGFAPAVNLAAKESDADYIALLNNDCRLKPGWLITLVETINAGSGCACAGSMVLDRSGQKIDFHRGTANIFGWGFHLDRGEDISTAGSEPFKSLFACGAACAYDRKIFLELGGLSDPMFAFFEDVEMGWRLNAAGCDVVINPESFVEHHHGATVSRFGKGFHAFLKERNALMNAYCNLEATEADAILPIAMSLSAIRFAARTGMHPETALGEIGADALLPGRKKDGGGLKDTLKKIGSLSDPASSAIIEALADFGRHLPLLRERRRSLEGMRKVPTSEIVSLMGEPFRAVIGHERENSMIAETEPFIRECIGMGPAS